MGKVGRQGVAGLRWEEVKPLGRQVHCRLHPLVCYHPLLMREQRNDRDGELHHVRWTIARSESRHGVLILHALSWLGNADSADVL